ncbi:Cof-type HAD-IIB family hydrolase [Gracilibacillus alcaliphilus]|uniref:Cof-type HAD-IIB family hydrolase n=1 Tax=Gracilibacillus alcaliphilus TaxID=1401441 RepID=UPI001957E78A|nr:Cof-type HAD-IIB family hydrolase [Gracilibacillus alcaliphilus]MBM7678504.1 HAD superfamily hydrolase (TIGR01484 family) [Gracilibacillus alcaliphilus]
MTKEIKLIALDMDGTLLGDDHQVSEANKQAIKQAQDKGVEVIISTGRHYQTSSIVAKEIGIDYLITVNGSEIWTMSGELIARQTIEAETIKRLVELRDKHEVWAWLASVDGIWRGEAPEDLPAYQWLKLGFDTKDHHTRQAILDTISEWNEIEVSNSSPTNIEINAVGVHKAAAIEVICERLGITMDHVMAMGDSLNDIKMIEQAGLGIAMGNAQEAVKQVANDITAANSDDGVAKSIEKWVL